MSEQNETLDSVLIEKNNSLEDQYIISLNKFIILSIVSLGLYEIWWTYKAWRFYKQKENADIMPALRAIFSIFFLISLFDKILFSARERNYTISYSSVFLFAGYLGLSILVHFLPDSYSLFSVFIFVLFYIPPFKALNFVKLYSAEITAIEQDSFNTRQICLLVVGILFWVLLVYVYTAT